MKRNIIIDTASLLLTCAVGIALTLSSSVAFAQTMPPADELHTAILSTLLTDPRTADMAPEKLQQLVNALAGEAQSRSLSANDIRAMVRTSVPGANLILGPAPQQPAEMHACGMFPSLCPFNDALGFDGSDLAMAVWFLLALVMVFVFVLKLRHHHHEAHGTIPTPPWSGPTR